MPASTQLSRVQEEWHAEPVHDHGIALRLRAFDGATAEELQLSGCATSVTLVDVNVAATVVPVPTAGTTGGVPHVGARAAAPTSGHIGSAAAPRWWPILVALLAVAAIGGILLAARMAAFPLVIAAPTTQAPHGKGGASFDGYTPHASAPGLATAPAAGGARSPNAGAAPTAEGHAEVSSPFSRSAWLPAPALRWQPCGGSSSTRAGWAALSAYVDTRPLAYGGRPALVFIMLGPPKESGAGFMALVTPLAAHNDAAPGSAIEATNPAAGRATEAAGPEALRLPCLTPDVATYVDTHSKLLGRRMVVCPLPAAAWAEVIRLARVEACVTKAAAVAESGAEVAGGCPPRSAVPIGTLHNFPGYPLPAGQAVLDSIAGADGPRAGAAGAASRSTNDSDQAQATMRVHEAGVGRTAICIQPVRGDYYASSLAFFLEYYGAALGVDAVFMYMHSPGQKMLKAAADAVVAGGTGGRPAVSLVPWCATRRANYTGCSDEGGELPRESHIHNFAQALQLQDCLYRAVGAFRWVLNLDLDEYVRMPPARARGTNVSAAAAAAGGLRRITLAGLVKAQRAGGGKSTRALPAPAEIGFRTSIVAAGVPVEPGRLPTDVTVRVELSSTLRGWQSTERLAAAGVPYPAAAPIGQIAVLKYTERSKYAFDPLLVKTLSIHDVRETLCRQLRHAPWRMPCAAGEALLVLPPQRALLAHFWLSRVAAGAFWSPESLPGGGPFVLDWSLANWWLTRHPDGGRPA
jgi:hypothetical protein